MFYTRGNLMIETMTAEIEKVALKRIRSVYPDSSYKQALLENFPVSAFRSEEPKTIGQSSRNSQVRKRRLRHAEMQENLRKRTFLYSEPFYYAITKSNYSQLLPSTTNN